MKLVDRLASILIGGVVLTSLSFANIVVQPQSAVGLAQEDVNTIAEQITVMIDGSDDAQISKGSGVIVRREGNVYYVITNRHVVEKEDNYQLQTVDGNRYVVNYRQIQKIPGLDLAVIQFSSNQNYRVVQLGDSDRVSRPQKIYVFGYRTPGLIITTRRRVYAEGKISDFLVPPTSEGYALVYSLDIIQPGMSGGPVLNQQGRLIGINGLAEIDVRTGRADSIFGIPSNTFRNWQATIVPVLTESAIVQPTPTPTPSTTSAIFYCGMSDGQPVTFVQTATRGKIPLIVWVKPDLTFGWSPRQRCDKVSARFQEFYDNGTLDYVTAGKVDDRLVLCVSSKRESPCSLSNVLIYLSPGTDANAVLEQIFNLAGVVHL